jgi:methylmalonyl-CoA/ethylmalonyl-CoA epimerase
MVVDHVGIVVKSLDRGIAIWETVFGYSRLTEPVENSRQMVRVVFLHKKDSVLIKLVEPTDPASPAFGMASRGGGLHHLCFRVEDTATALEQLSAAGGRTMTRPQPGEAFENEPIAFAYLYGLPIEFIATEKKARRITS